MKANMGTADRIIRTVVAVALIALIFTGHITGVWVIVAGVVAAAFLLTSVVSFCPAYWPLRINTRGKSDEPAR
jgi:hypothetical protein